MSNLFTIAFLQGKTDAEDYGVTVHSLVDLPLERQIITLSLSADKLSSVSYYAREPKRLTFECFRNDWIDLYLLSGNYEHPRNICHYEVKVYRDDVLIFTGILDTSQIIDSGSNNPISFTCYDKIKLISLFSDLTQLYSLTSGYTAEYILGYLKNKIEAAIPISMPISTEAFEVPSLYIAGSTYATMIPLHSWDVSVMNTLPDNAGGWTYGWQGDSYVTPKCGYIVYTEANYVIFIMAHRKGIQGVYDGSTYRYMAKYRAAIVRFFNNICADIKEYEAETDWQDTEVNYYSDSDASYRKFFTDNGFDADVFLNALPSSVTLLGRTNYQWYYSSNVINSVFRFQILPVHLHPGTYYSQGQGNEQTPCLKVLQAMLMLYNATLIASPAGSVSLINKQPASSSPIAISDIHIVAFSRTREKPEIPDTSVMEVLAGDSSILQGQVKDYLLAYAGYRWKATITIDILSAYDLSLHSYIIVQDSTYFIVEIAQNYINDEYQIVAWLSE
jgi:hypothetical protein